jgi:hypothetical protein
MFHGDIYSRSIYSGEMYVPFVLVEHCQVPHVAHVEQGYLLHVVESLVAHKIRVVLFLDEFDTSFVGTFAGI